MPDVFLTGSTSCSGRIAGALTGDWSLGGSTRVGGHGFLTAGLEADEDLAGSLAASGALAGDLEVDVDLRGSESPGARLAGDMGVEVDIAGSVVALAYGTCQLTGTRHQTDLAAVGRLLEGSLVEVWEWGGDVLPLEAASAAPVAAPAQGKGIVFQGDGTIWVWDGAAWQQAGGGAPAAEESMVTNYDKVDGTDTSYIGEAGSATSAAVWRIRKMVEGSDGDVTITYADGNSNFDNIWDNRASLSYS